MGYVLPIIDHTIDNAECLVTQTFWKHNYATFNCSHSINTSSLDSKCPGVNLNPVSAALANCEWCYPKYGCFQVGGPYISLAHPISLPPEPIPCMGLLLQLYTQSNKFWPYNFRADDDENKVKLSPFNPAFPSIFIIGGFQSGDFRPYDRMYIEGFLNCKRYNVFVVNWVIGSSALYEQAIANARLVGAMLAKFITLLKDKLNYAPSNCHLIGLSLGGIVAAETGKRVENLGRISGLDSAGPYFHHADPIIRLDASDATFVDLIHSNAGEAGTIDKAGDLDFWPNGGSIQTGCGPIRRIENGIIYEILLCSHVKSLYYYYYSLPCAPVKCNFTAHMCSNCLNYEACKRDGCGADGSKCAKMGFNSIDYKLANYPLPGVQSFYLETNPDAPFCKD